MLGVAGTGGRSARGVQRSGSCMDLSCAHSMPVSRARSARAGRSWCRHGAYTLAACAWHPRASCSLSCVTGA
eukprot:5080799-Alexandrium_andersonii.AAC.1